MSNVSNLEGSVIMKRESTKQKAYLSKQIRIITVPSIIQKGFWACSTCEWPLTAPEAFSDGLGFRKTYLHDPWLRETADWDIPELFCSVSIHFENRDNQGFPQSLSPEV